MRAPVKQSPDLHGLYEASVQSVEENLGFIERTYRKQHGRRPRVLCEDFCGTARLACEWVLRRKKNQAIGIDLDQNVLHWARTQNVSFLAPDSAARLQLIQGDVLDPEHPSAEVIAAFNFSYFIFHDRETLRKYLSNAWTRLREGGMLVLDSYGGYGSYQNTHESRAVYGRKTLGGEIVADFGYEWEQTKFNPVTHRILNYIHFELPDGRRYERAFRYDWRLWTLPELSELLQEAGFRDVAVYTHGWDEDGGSDDLYLKVKSFENEESWLAYCVAWK